MEISIQIGLRFCRQKYNNAINSFGLRDYEDEIYGNKGIISDSKISISGGNEKTQFYVATSYRDEEGIIKNGHFLLAILYQSQFQHK